MSSEHKIRSTWFLSNEWVIYPTLTMRNLYYPASCIARNTDALPGDLPRGRTKGQNLVWHLIYFDRPGLRRIQLHYTPFFPSNDDYFTASLQKVLRHEYIRRFEVR